MATTSHPSRAWRFRSRVVGEAYAWPQVAPHVLHPALDLPLGLGPVGLTLPGLKADPQGEVQHPPVPYRPVLLVPAQGDHLGVVVQTAAGHAAQVLESIRVALDGGGGVRLADQFHVAGPGPTQGHHEHPDAALFAIPADVGQAAPVHLGLFTGPRLETASWPRAVGLAAVGGHTALPLSSCPGIPWHGPPVPAPGNSPALRPSAGRYARRRGPA